MVEEAVLGRMTLYALWKTNSWLDPPQHLPGQPSHPVHVPLVAIEILMCLEEEFYAVGVVLMVSHTDIVEATVKVVAAKVVVAVAVAVVAAAKVAVVVVAVAAAAAKVVVFVAVVVVVVAVVADAVESVPVVQLASFVVPFDALASMNALVVLNLTVVVPGVVEAV
jgi:hypothetical protein